MPDYKKKNHKHSSKTKKQHRASEEIQMRHKGAEKEENPKQNTGKLRVVKGNKRRKQAITRGIFVSVVVVILTVVLVNILLPTGIGDFVKNAKYAFGTGEFPVELVGSDSLFSNKQGNLFYALTDTNLEIISRLGKKALSSPHGFSKPVMRTSPTRAIVYEQGSTGFKLFGVDKLLVSKDFDDNIIAANLSRSGAYVVATNSKDFASKVTVYSKNSKMLFEWNSSVEIVSDVALSPNGKKLAVSTFNSDNGQYVSKIYFFEYDSASPVHTVEYNGKIIYSLETQISSGLFALFDGGVDFVSWNKFTRKEFSTDYNLRMYRATPQTSVLASSRSNDKKDTKFTAFSRSGSKAFEFQWKESITDFAVFGDKILILSDTSVYLVDKNGSMVKKGDAGFGGVSIQAISGEKAVVITDNSMINVTLIANK